MEIGDIVLPILPVVQEQELDLLEDPLLVVDMRDINTTVPEVLLLFCDGETVWLPQWMVKVANETR